MWEYRENQHAKGQITGIEYESSTDGDYWTVWMNLDGWNGENYIGSYDTIGEASEALYDAFKQYYAMVWHRAQKDFSQHQKELEAAKFRALVAQTRSKELVETSSTRLERRRKRRHERRDDGGAK